MDEQLQRFERDFFRELELSTSYYDYSRHCAVMAIMYLAFGFANLGLNRFCASAYCMSQAARVGAMAAMGANVSKILKEEKSHLIGEIQINPKLIPAENN
jgi:hypothetical protein